MRGSDAKRVQEEHLHQLNTWLEEYRSLAEKRDRENFQLKLQIAQLFESAKEKDHADQMAQSYIVELEETIRLLGDELELSQQQLTTKTQEVSRLQSLLQINVKLSESELKHTLNSNIHDYEELVAETLQLHMENQAYTQRVTKLEEIINNKESQTLDLRARVKELEQVLTAHRIAFNRHSMHNAADAIQIVLGNSQQEQSPSRIKDSTPPRFLDSHISSSPDLQTQTQIFRRPDSRTFSESDDEYDNKSPIVKISRDLTNKVSSWSRRGGAGGALRSYQREAKEAKEEDGAQALGEGDEDSPLPKQLQTRRSPEEHKDTWHHNRPQYVQSSDRAPFIAGRWKDASWLLQPCKEAAAPPQPPARPLDLRALPRRADLPTPPRPGTIQGTSSHSSSHSMSHAANRSSTR
jgi:hypothetical protein